MSGTGKPRSKRKSLQPQRVIFDSGTSREGGEETQREVRYSSAQTHDGGRPQYLPQMECDAVRPDPSSRTLLKNKKKLKKHVMGGDEGDAKSDEASVSGARRVLVEKDASAKDDSDESAEEQLSERAIDNPDRLTCDSCNERFQNFSSLNRHKLIHSGERPFKCDTGEKAFEQKSGSSRDEKTLNNESQLPYVCDICPKRFRWKRNLTNHKKIHTTVRQYFCDVCQKSFKTLKYIMNHKRNHKDNRKFVCDICQRGFKKRHHWTDHQLVHSDERPHTCDLCEKKFKSNRELTNHKKMHVEDRPFACDLCEKRFKTNYALQGHKISHSDDRPFQCHVCNVAFKQKRYLNKHMRNAHRNARL